MRNNLFLKCSPKRTAKYDFESAIIFKRAIEEMIDSHLNNINIDLSIVILIPINYLYWPWGDLPLMSMGVCSPDCTGPAPGVIGIWVVGGIGVRPLP